MMLKLKIGKSLLSLLLGAVGSLGVGSVDDAKEVVQSHETYAMSNNLNGVMTNIADDVVVLADGTPLKRGKEAFRG